MSLVTEEKTIKWYNHLERRQFERIEIVWTEPKPVAIICDHDAEGRATFEKHTGLGTQPAIKYVNDGIDTHKARLKGDAQGPYFYLMRDALVERDENLAHKLYPVCTEQEYPAYAWKVEAVSGRTLDEPVKRDDHGMDTDRYFSMHLDFRGKARVTILDTLED
jgi:phage terminase large subunit